MNSTCIFWKWKKHTPGSRKEKLKLNPQPSKYFRGYVFQRIALIEKLNEKNILKKSSKKVYYFG